MIRHSTCPVQTRVEGIRAVQCGVESDSVNPDEIEQVIRANIDKTVCVVYTATHPYGPVPQRL